MSRSSTARRLGALAVATVLNGPGVSARQRKGCDCLLCGIVLTPDTAVGLGKHTHQRAEAVPVACWPRSCQRCYRETW